MLESMWIGWKSSNLPVFFNVKLVCHNAVIHVRTELA